MIAIKRLQASKVKVYIVIPILDLTRQYKQIQAELEPKVLAQLASGSYILGPTVEKFEAAMADYLNTQHTLGVASGTDRAREATIKAINSPLLDDIKLEGATGLLVSVAGNADVSLEEFDTVGEIVAPLAEQGVAIKVGMIVDEDIGDDIRVTVVATGLSKAPQLATAGVQAAATVNRPRSPLGTPAPAAPSIWPVMDLVELIWVF